MRVLEAGALYFSLVFAAGFVLGAIRTLWVAPRIGTRISELAEIPLMLVVIFLASRWTVELVKVPYTPPFRLGMGCVALILMLIAEFGFVLWIRGLTVSDYIATRDPVSGTVYYLTLVVFAIVPFLDSTLNAARRTQ